MVFASRSRRPHNHEPPGHVLVNLLVSMHHGAKGSNKFAPQRHRLGTVLLLKVLSLNR